MIAGDQAVVSVFVLQQLVQSLVVEQALVMNEKFSYKVRHGKLLAVEEEGAHGAEDVSIRAGIRVKMDKCDVRLSELMLLLKATHGIIHLLSNSSARGHLHFPALRAHLPTASMLVLAMSGGASAGKTGPEGMAVLESFAEYSEYVKQWHGP